MTFLPEGFKINLISLENVPNSQLTQARKSSCSGENPGILNVGKACQRTAEVNNCKVVVVSSKNEIIWSVHFCQQARILREVHNQFSQSFFDENSMALDRYFTTKSG